MQQLTLRDLVIAERYKEEDVKYIPVDQCIVEGDLCECGYNLISSVKKIGIQEPIIVTKQKDEYIILSGRLRYAAAKYAGFKFIPVIEKAVTEDEINIIRIELQATSRKLDKLTKSKLAEIVSQYHSRIKSQGKRSDLTSSPLVKKLDAGKATGALFDMGPRTVGRYLRVMYLNDELKYDLDLGRLSLRSAVILSYLNKETQDLISTITTNLGFQLTEQQAKSILIMSSKKELTAEDVYKILCATVKEDTLNKVVRRLLKKYGFEECMGVREVETLLDVALKYYLGNSTNFNLWW